MQEWVGLQRVRAPATLYRTCMLQAAGYCTVVAYGSHVDMVEVVQRRTITPTGLQSHVKYKAVVINYRARCWPNVVTVVCKQSSVPRSLSASCTWRSVQVDRASCLNNWINIHTGQVRWSTRYSGVPTFYRRRKWTSSSDSIERMNYRAKNNV